MNIMSVAELRPLTQNPKNILATTPFQFITIVHFMHTKGHNTLFKQTNISFLCPICCPIAECENILLHNIEINTETDHNILSL